MTTWTDAVKQPLLANEYPRRLIGFLQASLPRFRAPTDAAWPKRAAALRRAALKRVYLRGYDPALVAAPPRVLWGEVLRPHPDYVVRKLAYEALPDYWIPALLYEPARLTGRTIAVLNPNGHHRGGKAADYKQARCINLAKRGAIALNFEFLGMSELEADADHNRIAFLDFAGVAGVGVFYLAMRKGLDVLCAHPNADPARVAVTGLSGGGWQTIVLSALDERVTLSVPVAGYTAVRARLACPCDIGDLEQAPVDLCTVADYQDLTALLAPRPALLILNEKDDCCFQTARTRPVIYDAVQPTYAALGAADRFATHNNRDPGTHNYGADNRAAFYRFVGKHFGLPGPATDLPFEGELLPEPATHVGLPASQTTVREMAYARAKAAVRQHATPQTAAEQAALRKRLVAVLRLPRYLPTARRISRDAGAGDTTITQWVLRCGRLPVPVTALTRPGAQRAQLLLPDGGRAYWHAWDAAPDAAIFVADLAGAGECRGDWQRWMIAECAGHRLLGLRVAQTLALADFVARQTKVKRIELVPTGVNACIAGALAVALRPQQFAAATLNELPHSFLRLYEWGTTYDAAQFALCFGLLEVADLPQILSLARGVELRQPGRATVPWRP